MALNTLDLARMCCALTMLYLVLCLVFLFFFFFFNDTATTEIYTLSLHDALPISGGGKRNASLGGAPGGAVARNYCERGDRKSTRLNSSHGYISYAVFCLKKKKKKEIIRKHHR